MATAATGDDVDRIHRDLVPVGPDDLAVAHGLVAGARGLHRTRVGHRPAGRAGG